MPRALWGDRLLNIYDELEDTIDDKTGVVSTKIHQTQGDENN